ncbi:single-stranded DNA-binding protein [Patescibacteria group bacterium]|nr:single-stranded DNA-binding protein [Patescibacteria group bacterium]
MYLNKVLLYGNLTRDPEVRALPSGQQVANFSIATNRTFTDKEGRKQDSTEYHNIVAFGRQAEVIGQYMKKGRPLFVEGRLQTRSWEAEGKKNYRTEIVIDNFQFGPSAPGAGGSMGGSTGGAQGSNQNSSSSSAGASGSMPDMNSAAPSSDEIQYPDDEINPEDIPF